MGYRTHFIKILFVTVVSLSLSCSDTGDCFKGTGRIIIDVRHPGNFSGITVSDDINLMLVQDTVQKVYIEAGENLLPGISSQVITDMLNLHNYNICKYLRSYQKEITAEVHFSTLEMLGHAGSAKILSADTIIEDKLLLWLDGARGEIILKLKVGALTVEHRSGNGNTTLRGSATNCIINSKAQGFLDLSELKTGNLKMQADSYNDAYIWVSDTLEVTLLNIGNVYYKGNPYIKNVEQVGEGKLIRTD